MLRDMNIINNIDALGMPMVSLHWVDNGDFQNGLPDSYYLVNNSGVAPTASTFDGFVTVGCGTNAAAQVAMAGDFFGHYNSGQALIGIGSSKWDAGVVNNTRKFGMFNPSAEYGIELTGTTWRVFHRSGGVQCVRTLTVTTGATGAGNVTVTLNGTAFTVALTTTGSTTATARELANGTYAGWTATATGSVVTYVSNWSGVKAGSFTFSAGATGVVVAGGAPALLRAGATYTLDTAIALTAVNGDRLDGTGPSRQTISAGPIFVFRFGHGYLGGAGPQIEILRRGSNRWDMVHVFEHGGVSSAVNLNPPSLYVGWQNINTGNTTNVNIYGASYAIAASNGTQTGKGRCPSNSALRTLSTGSMLPVFAIRMAQVKSGRVNWDEFEIDQIEAYSTASTRTLFQAWLNPTYGAVAAVWTASSIGAVEYDESGTSVSIGSGEVVGEKYVNGAGSVVLNLVRDIVLQRGDVLVIVATGTGGGSFTCDASITGIER